MPKPVSRNSVQAISTRLPEIFVEYDCDGQRLTKHFKDARQARRFYTQQFELDNNPSLLRSDSMSATTPKKSVKKATTKKTAPKGATSKTTTKKSTKKAPATKKTAKGAKEAKGAKTTDGPKKKRTPAGVKPDYLRKPQIAILELLSKSSSGLSRADISEKVSGNMSEHLGSVRESAKPNMYTKSLMEWGYVKAEQVDEDGKDVVVYVITASGNKALQKESSSS